MSFFPHCAASTRTALSGDRARPFAGRAWRNLLTALALLVLAALLAPPAAADVLDEIELLRAGDDAVVRIRFGVRMQYLRHLPIGDDGADIFIQISSATSLALTDERRRVAETPSFPGVSVHLPLQSRVGEPSRLEVRFTRPVKFIVRQFGANGVDLVLAGLGSQVSALRPRPGADAMTPSPGQRFAVRLQSFRTREAVDAPPVPSEFQELTAFTTQSVVDGSVLYELMLGYFATAEDAERARRRLAARFPDAEVIDLVKRRDEAQQAAAATTPPPPVAAPAPAPEKAAETPGTAAVVPPPLAAASPPAALPPARAADEVERQAAELMSKARAAQSANAPQDAVDSLNQLLMLPPNSQSEGAQELIGLAREQAGETAKARAEYELYLKLYPDGAGAERVRQRLAQLAAPATVASSAQRGERPTERPAVKSVTGSFSQYYYGGQTRVENVFNTPTSQERSSFSAVDQSMLLTTVDLNGRYRSGDAEQRVVVRDAYSLSFLSERASYNRLNAAFYDYRQLSGGLAARLGRQTGLGAGLPGRFDGGIVGYGSQQVRMNLAGGEPVEFNEIDSRRRFADLYLEAGGLASQWSGNVFGIYQEVDGIVDRQAVGGELRFVDGVRSLYGLVDYDTSYRVMNAASVQGSWTTRGGTSINVLWDRRRAPTLTTTNAIIGQPTTSISTLLQTSTEDQIRQAAMDITAVALQASVGFTTPVTERWQVGADVRLINVGALPEVVFNGVTIPAQPATGNLINYSLQAIGTRLYSPRDSNVWNFGILTAPNYDSWLLTYNNVTHLGEKWSIEPAIRLYGQKDVADVRLFRLSPGLRLTWRPTLGSAIELDGLFEHTKTTSTNASDTSRRYFYSVGYRLDI